MTSAEYQLETELEKELWQLLEEWSGSCELSHQVANIIERLAKQVVEETATTQVKAISLEEPSGNMDIFEHGQGCM